jgi:hypothetical protein
MAEIDRLLAGIDHIFGLRDHLVAQYVAAATG